MNTVIAPKFAALYQEGKVQELQQIASKTMVLLVIVASPIAFIMVIFPEFIMSFFGDQFIEGANILMVLVFGQFIYVITGSVGYLLTMSGHERVMRNIMIACSGLIILLNIVLIPHFGALGAAIATATTLVFQNTFVAIAVWKIVGVVAIPFSGKVKEWLR